MRKLIVFVAVLSFAALGCNGHTGASKTTVVRKPEGKNLKRVIVLSFHQEGATKELTSSLEGIFCNDLFKAPGIELFCPGDLDNIIAYKKLQSMLGECQEGNCLSKIAEKTNAHRVITGKISKIGKKFIISVIIADGESGQVIARIAKQVDSDDVEDLMPGMREVSGKVQKEL